MTFHVRDPGTYRVRVYLDGKVMGEHPFQVNIERVIPTESGR